jgi:hypothetical protein
VMPSSVARSNLNKLLASYAALDMNQDQSQDLHEQLKVLSIAVFKNLLLDSSEALEYLPFLMVSGVWDDADRIKVIFKSLLCVSDEGIAPEGDEQRYLDSVQVVVKTLVCFMFAFDFLDRSFHDSGINYFF